MTVLLWNTQRKFSAKEIPKRHFSFPIGLFSHPAARVVGHPAKPYIYRDLRYEAEIDISGTPVLHEIRAEIRCYYEQEKNPFVVVPEEEKCRYHSLEKGPKR